MGKVISFELKKLVSRIGLYVLVLFLAGLLVASVFTYKPTKTQIPTASLSGETVTEMYSDFTSVKKAEQLNIFNETSNNADGYISTSTSYVKSNNKEYITELFTNFDNRCGAYKDADVSSAQYIILLDGIKIAFNTLKTELDTALSHSKNQTGYYILTTEDNYTDLYVVIDKLMVNFESPVNHKVVANKYFDTYRAELLNCLNKLIYPSLDKVAQEYSSTGNYHTLITFRMDEIEQKMSDLNSLAISNADINTSDEYRNKLNELYNRYSNCASVFNTAYNSRLGAEALDCVKSKYTRSHLLGYSSTSVYNLEETAVEYEYYIEHNTNPSNYARSFSVTHTSNSEINAYDYCYYAMSIFSIVVIIFAIYLASNTISGEINNNSLRLMAIRPTKRGSIFFGKYISIVLISLLLLVFGTATSFLVGSILYGTGSANILMIINGYYVFSVHPALMLAIFVGSLLLMVAFYTAITMLLSSILKLDVLALIIGAVFYIVNLILPVLFNSSSWLRFYPFTNINLFAYFSSSRMTADTVLGNMLNTVVYQGMNLWISLAYVFGISIIVLLIGKAVFKKREL